MRLLIVEDSQSLAASLKRGLEADGFAVDVQHTGTDGLCSARETRYDAIVLDLMLPGLNGYQVCAALRAERNWTPILMLTAAGDELDIAEGLDTGADDYLVKPFSHVVLVARLRALMRRGRPRRPVVLQNGELKLDPGVRQAWYAGQPLQLTSREFCVLEYLLRRGNETASKRDILDHVWDGDFDGDPNIVEVYIRYLRKKLEPLNGVSIIQTVRGAGYRLIGTP